MYVKDAVRAIFKVLERKATGVFCIADLRSHPINDLVEMMNEVFGYKVKRIVKEPVEGEIEGLEINTSKARSNLYFSCHYTLWDGVKETYAWYKEMQNAD